MGPTLLTRDRMQAIYGVSQDSLRLYERCGLLQPVLAGEIRFYTPQDCVRLEIIIKGKRFGFSLREIEELVLGTPEPVATPPADPVVATLDRERLLEELRSLAVDRERVGASIDQLKALLAGK